MTTDREMLELCLDAFKAIPTALGSRIFMRRNGFPSQVGRGNASYQLADSMYRRIKNHIEMNDPERED